MAGGLGSLKLRKYFTKIKTYNFKWNHTKWRNTKITFNVNYVKNIPRENKKLKCKNGETIHKVIQIYINKEENKYKNDEKKKHRNNNNSKGIGLKCKIIKEILKSVENLVFDRRLSF